METAQSLRRALALRQVRVSYGAMMRALLICAVLGLAACAAAPAAEDTPTADLAFGIGADLSCNASDQSFCAPGECAGGEGGTVSPLPISLHVPAGGGEGRFCMATGCEDAHFEPTLTRALGWTATMTTNDRSSLTADLEISRDLRTFRLRDGDSEGVSTWSGECSPAGS
jgi:hypothetical protein